MHSKDTTSKKIEEVNYELILLNTSRAFITGQKILKLSLPSAGVAADGLMGSDEFSENDTFTSMAMFILRQMDEVDILEIIKELLEGLKADGEVVDFEKYFRGDIGLLVEVIEFALRSNYSSLFTGSNLTKKLMTFMREFQILPPQNETSETSIEPEQSSTKTPA